MHTHSKSCDLPGRGTFAELLTALPAYTNSNCVCCCCFVSCSSERVNKYNQLMRIEQELGDKAVYAGENWRFISITA